MDKTDNAASLRQEIERLKKRVRELNAELGSSERTNEQGRWRWESAEAALANLQDEMEMRCTELLDARASLTALDGALKAKAGQITNAVLAATTTAQADAAVVQILDDTLRLCRPNATVNISLVEPPNLVSPPSKGR
jgi:chromosome segregation ATPase